jgi:hypothetical protein
MLAHIRRWSLTAALLVAHGAALATSALVLNDGQVIRGNEVRRDGDNYLVVMAAGNTVTFPGALVKEVKIDDEGAPTRWSKDAVDTSWQPTNAYDPNADVMANTRSKWSEDAVDTQWQPTSAYDPNKDVMEGSRSTWGKNAVDTEWKPQDGFGFKKLSYIAAAPPTGMPSAPSLSRGPGAWECAEAIFAKTTDVPASDKENRPASMTVKPLTSALYANLGVPLYEADAPSSSGSRKAVLAVSGGACRLVGGDVDSILGLELTPEYAIAQDAASFNAAMASRGGANVPAGVDKLDYAFAFVSLTDPAVSGGKAATLKLIASADDLHAISSKAPASCTLAKGKRRKSKHAASVSFTTPKITAGKDADIVSFLTWSSAEGEIYKNTVVLARAGVVSAHRETVASHVGAHQDSGSR